MQQLILTPSNHFRFLAAALLAFVLAMASNVVVAQAPMVRHADIDFDASGYVTPAGMVPPSMYQGGVQPVGYCDAAPCDRGYCDNGCDGGGYDGGGCCGAGCCGGGCLRNGCCGLLRKLTTYENGLSPLRHLCMFCRGGGCSACQYIGRGYVLGALQSLLPYREAGTCSQRWYDISAEALFLSKSTSSIGTDVITRQGPDQNGGLAGVPVILADDILSDDLEAGFRLSAAFIFGAGGNLEGTYMGGQRWEDSQTALAPAVFVGAPPALDSGADLFSFITEFGTNPTNLDDVDRSVSQTASYEASFDSGEINYRRRTVGPYCRFQGSWLVGLRYMQFNNDLGLNIVGLNDDGTGASPADADLRFFNSRESTDNRMLGAQLGGDLWWNMIPGVNVGVGFKGAWLNNDVVSDSFVQANSINNGAPGSVVARRRMDKGTFATELEAKLIYRLTHSWSVRSAYYLITIDDVANSTFDADFIRDAVPVGANVTPPRLQFDSLVLEGFSVGAEYIW